MGTSGGGTLSGPRWEIGEHDAAYPARLRDCERHPTRLYVIGNPDALSGETVSVVGARKATPYGIACAQLAARCAVEMGIGVTSGAAIGCDQASQNEALDRGGQVLAILGSGADVVYPPNAEHMLGRIVEGGGAVVSLQPWGAPPARWAFIRRNAVIATIARVLVICEAGMPSGTFSTAQCAADAGREVLAFPGSIFSPNSTGSNYLIASDANVIPIWDQKCLEIAYSRNYGMLRRPMRDAQVSPAVDGAQREVKTFKHVLGDALAASPTTPGQLASALGVDLPHLMRVLAKLEMSGCVRRLVDGRYSLTERELLAHNTG